VIRSSEPTAATRTVEEATFRTVMAAFPASVAIVSAYAGELREPRGMTASSFLSVSLRPMLVLVSVANGAHMHALLERRERYAVSLLDHRHRGLARGFSGAATGGERDAAEVHWREVAAAPVLEDACAHVVVETRDRHGAGDHTLFIGEVRAMAPPPRSTRPLAYQQGRFGHIVADDDHWVGELDPWGGSHHIAWG
jgi:flavin reductase (DIM6/NTAB) family NADH-FMN oxidoreductase RutF